MYYSIIDHRFLKFEKSTTRGKKYDAILQRIQDGKVIRVPFGEIGYEQYQDSTGLDLYSKFDHKDPNRRILYHERHRNDILKGMYSPGFFSMQYLW